MKSKFYCGSCAQPVYSFRNYPLCGLCAYERQIQLLRAQKLRRELENYGRPEGAGDGSALEGTRKV